MPYESSLSFDSVIVIQSLRPNDEPTGKDLFQNSVAPGLKRHDMYGEFYEISSVSEFRGALHAALRHAQNRRAPILHFDVHGDQEGIEMATGERLEWSELAPILSAINEACQVNLLVVAAACHGWFLSSVLRPIQRTPAWGIIGPPDSIGHRDLVNAMHRFYTELLLNIDLTRALRAANLAQPAKEAVFRLTSAELLFCRVFRYYMRDLEDGETQDQRVNRLVAEIARAKHLDVHQTIFLRTQITSSLNDHRAWFAYYRERFLMLDLFPQNRDRFAQGFDDCVGAA